MADNDFNNSSVKEATLHAVDYLQVLRNRWKEIILTFLLVFMAAGVVTYLLPRVYRTSARFQINVPQVAIDVFRHTGRTVLDPRNTSNYHATQFEVINSPETLKYAVRKLNLTKQWGVPEDAAIMRLRGMVEVVPVRATELVDIYVRGSDPVLVQDIAESVVDAYQQRREMEENEYAVKAIRKLQERLQMANDELTQRNLNLRQLVNAHNIIGVIWTEGPLMSTETTAGEETAHKQAQDSIRNLERQITELSSHIAEIQKLEDDQLLNYVISSDLLSAESVGPSTLRRMFTEYQDRLREREGLLATGYGPKHQKIAAMDETTARLKQDLDKALVGLRASLSGKLTMLEANLTTQQQKAEILKQELTKKTEIDSLLLEAKRTYSVALERVREMEKSYIIEVNALSIPRVPIVVHEHALKPHTPVSPNVSLNLGVGAAAGLVLGLIVAFVLEYFDTSVKTVEEVEKALGVPVIGVVPKDIKVFYQEPGENPDAEAYRILRTNIELAKKGINEVSMAFVSGTAGEGKTTTLCNLAYVYAQAGYTTLVIDADMRRSKLNQVFDLDNSYGLSNYLTSDAVMEDVVVETALENLYVLPSGPSPRDPSGLLSSRKMAELVREAKNRFDIVLLDSPPILGVSDSAIIVRLVDMTVMVVQPRKLSEKVLKKEREVIEASGGNLIGTVMNNVDIGSDHQYQYYTTYYMYTPGEGSKKVRKSKSATQPDVDGAPDSTKQRAAAPASRPASQDSEDLY